jgi:phosphohistidine swiveling domain-containing protein
MKTALVSNFKTARGREFHVRWDDEAQAGRAWLWNDSHFPDPLVPVFEWIHRDLGPQETPYQEAGVEPPNMFRGRLVPNGFQYVRMTVLDPGEQAAFAMKAAALNAKCGGAGRVWETFAQARTEAAVRGLQESSPETPIAELSRLYHAAMHNSHIGGPGAFGPVLGPLQAIVGVLFEPSEAALLVQELGQGADSATMESNRAVNRMAELARKSPGVARIVAEGGEEALAQLRREPGGSAFCTAFDTFIAEYGWRASGWDITNPTLRERPTDALNLVRQAMVARDGESASRAEVLKRRDKAVARIESQLAGDFTQIERFRSLAGQLENYVAVREGRALWQLMATGALRMALLKKGAAMASAGVVDAAGDVFFVLPGEIDPFFAAGRSERLQPLVAERRKEWQSWLGDKPPAVISADPMLIPSPAAPPDDAVVHGLPGSRGMVTAKARVLLDFTDCDELEPGEVLVCVMTSPPWTPLFAVASAIVTDSGAAFSHPAIAAREFGIPAVVGAMDATVRIQTGDTITVDGDAGTVRIEARG